MSRFCIVNNKRLLLEILEKGEMSCSLLDGIIEDYIYLAKKLKLDALVLGSNIAPGVLSYIVLNGRM